MRLHTHSDTLAEGVLISSDQATQDAVNGYQVLVIGSMLV